ncbi:MAG: ferritin-like domain-containing protein [Acidobacteriota bacterium]
MNQETLQQLFIEQIRDLYDAEKQIVKALPKMAKAVHSEELAEALRGHLEETLNQVRRLEEIFKLRGVPAKGKTCKAMKGLLEEGSEILEEEDGELLDLAVIAAAQRVEHYEISAYGTAKCIARQLGDEKAVKLLNETEEEEAGADQKMTEIAMSLYAAGDSDASDEEQEPQRRGAQAVAGQRTAAKKGMAGGQPVIRKTYTGADLRAAPARYSSSAIVGS